MVRAAGQARGVIAEGDGLADERGVDLEDHAVETDGPVLLDLALILEENERREVLRATFIASTASTHRRISRSLKRIATVWYTQM